jgi:hypothetical protein
MQIYRVKAQRLIDAVEKDIIVGRECYAHGVIDLEYSALCRTAERTKPIVIP